MAEMKMTADAIGVRLELTRIGKRLVAEGKIKAPVEVTPELIAKRKKAIDAARTKSQASKKVRLAKRNKRALPPMTDKEKRRTTELAKRAKAHEKADKERADAAKKTKAAKGKGKGKADADADGDA